MRLSRRAFLTMSGTSLAGMAQNRSGSERPNILLIVADDLGYGDLSCYGAKDLRSPNIDSLATNGTRFVNFYSNSPVCSPTRAALLSGQYPDRVGVPGVLRRLPASNWGHLAEGTTLFPAVLQRAGYRTALVGKWHLGHEDGKNTPTRHGFQTFRGLLGGMLMDYYTHQGHQAEEPDMWDGTRRIAPKGHATDLIGEWAVDTVRGWAGSDQPSFLYLAFNAPHAPIQPPPDWVEKVKHRERNISDARAKIVALIEHMDQAVGRVISALKETKKYENTLIVFTSDNGGQCNLGASNGGFRGCKEDVYEGGIRVPMIAAWPGKIPSGAQSNWIGMSMDLAPTLCEAAGVQMPATIDGRSLLPVFRGQPPAPWERDLYWVRREGGARYMGKTIHALRRGDWKLVHNSPYAPTELYNLAEDPTEQHNLALKRPDIHDALLRALQLHIQRGGRVAWQAPQ